MSLSYGHLKLQGKPRKCLAFQAIVVDADKGSREMDENRCWVTQPVRVCCSPISFGLHCHLKCRMCTFILTLRKLGSREGRGLDQGAVIGDFMIPTESFTVLLLCGIGSQLRVY